MTAVLYVLKVVSPWVTWQICKYSQLLVDMVYWLLGWDRVGCKTKSEKLIEKADLWQEIKEALEDRMGETWWIKVPSHTDIEGNKQC